MAFVPDIDGWMPDLDLQQPGFDQVVPQWWDPLPHARVPFAEMAVQVVLGNLGLYYREIFGVAFARDWIKFIMTEVPDAPVANVVAAVEHTLEAQDDGDGKEVRFALDDNRIAATLARMARRPPGFGGRMGDYGNVRARARGYGRPRRRGAYRRPAYGRRTYRRRYTPYRRRRFMAYRRRYRY